MYFACILFYSVEIENDKNSHKKKREWERERAQYNKTGNCTKIIYCENGKIHLCINAKCSNGVMEM